MDKTHYFTPKWLTLNSSHDAESKVVEPHLDSRGRRESADKGPRPSQPVNTFDREFPSLLQADTRQNASVDPKPTPSAWGKPGATPVNLNKNPPPSVKKHEKETERIRTFPSVSSTTSRTSTPSSTRNASTSTSFTINQKTKSGSQRPKPAPVPLPVLITSSSKSTSAPAVPPVAAPPSKSPTLHPVSYNKAASSLSANDIPLSDQPPSRAYERNSGPDLPPPSRGWDGNRDRDFQRSTSDNQYRSYERQDRMQSERSFNHDGNYYPEDLPSQPQRNHYTNGTGKFSSASANWNDDRGLYRTRSLPSHHGSNGFNGNYSHADQGPSRQAHHMKSASSPSNGHLSHPPGFTELPTRSAFSAETRAMRSPTSQLSSEVRSSPVEVKPTSTPPPPPESSFSAVDPWAEEAVLDGKLQAQQEPRHELPKSNLVPIPADQIPEVESLSAELNHSSSQAAPIPISKVRGANTGSFGPGSFGQSPKNRRLAASPQDIPLSSSVEREEQFMRQLGWSDNNDDDYEITEEEMQEFAMLHREKSSSLSSLRNALPTAASKGILQTVVTAPLHTAADDLDSDSDSDLSD